MSVNQLRKPEIEIVSAMGSLFLLSFVFDIFTVVVSSTTYLSSDCIDRKVCWANRLLMFCKVLFKKQYSLLPILSEKNVTST